MIWRRAISAALSAAAIALVVAAPSAQAAAPVPTTGAATELHFSRAVLTGAVNPSGQAIEECVFEYGETAAYGKTSPCLEPDAAEIGSGAGPVAVHARLTGLLASTEYHFRLSARNAAGTIHGADQTFTTLARPQLSVTVEPNAEYVLPGAEATFKVIVENTGDDETFGEIKVKNSLPPALAASQIEFYYIGISFIQNDNLAPLLCPSSAECRFPGVLSGEGVPALKPGEKLVMIAIFSAPGLEGPLADFGEVSGGGAARAESSATIQVSAEPAFGHLGFHASIVNAAHEPYTQAGGHPYEYSMEFDFSTLSCIDNSEVGTANAPYSSTCPLYDPRNITTLFPPGLLVNTQAVPHCRLADFFSDECEKLKDAVGTLDLRPYAIGSSAFKYIEPVYNLQSSSRYPGQLGATVGNVPFVMITSSIRDGGDYGITGNSSAVQAGLNHLRLNLWGVPADHGHDNFRAKQCEAFGDGAPGDYYGVGYDFLSREALEEWCELENTRGGDPFNKGGAAETPEAPFITMPTECAGEPLTVRGRYDTWQHPELYAEASAQLPPVEGCNALSFEPTIEARPTTTLADAPSGLEFDLHVPQNEDPQGVATPELKESVVTLPAGIRLNPASANGRRGCSEEQANLHVEAPSECPDASKIGEAEIISSLLHEPLKGSLFLAAPHQNPFGSLLAAYLSVEAQGIRIKAPGLIETDPVTGQITTRFPQNPQLPFEDLKLRIFGGALGTLRTPTTCGVYQTTASMTPFSAPESGPPATPTASFETSEAENGGACPSSASQEPNAPRFTAGTETPQAGTYAPFALKLVRDDGSQEVTGVDTTLPPGLIGRLAGTLYCPEAAIAQARSREHEGGGAAEQASPSCPAASALGSVDIAAGAGPTPIHVPGRVYLAGPYKGAPLSFVIVTPALAGPFDLGTVVVRVAVQVDPETIQITAKSDPIPTILDGIPLDVRQIALKLSRSKFTLNPTNCQESTITGAASSALGAVALLSQRFQVGGCSALAFKPKLSLQLKGGTKRSDHPALKAILTMPSGGANIASAQVSLPHSEFLDQGHIKTVCTRPQLASHTCPPGSVYGHARAITPLLDKPLEGPVYLGTGFGHELPDLVADLNGQLEVFLHGKVDTDKAEGIRNTFEVVPDAPVSKFVLALNGGKKGLLVNSTDICRGTHSAQAVFTGHNGRKLELTPQLQVRCGKSRKQRPTHRRAAAHGAQSRAGR